MVGRIGSTGDSDWALRFWQCRNSRNNASNCTIDKLPLQSNGASILGVDLNRDGFLDIVMPGDPLVVFFGDPTNPGTFLPSNYGAVFSSEQRRGLHSAGWCTSLGLMACRTC